MEIFSERKEGFAPEIFESQPLWTADKIKVCLADPWKVWEAWSSHNVTCNEGKQPNTTNLQPKKKNKPIKEIFMLTTRVGSWQSSKRAVWAWLLIMRSPEPQINSSGVKWLLFPRIWFFWVRMKEEGCTVGIWLTGQVQNFYLRCN